MTRNLSIVIVLLASLTGCSKKEDKKAADKAKPTPTPTEVPATGSAASASKTAPSEPVTPPGSASPTGSGSSEPAAGGAKCPDGQFGGGEMPFCIKLPDGYTGGAVSETGDTKVVEVVADGGFKKLYIKWEEALHDKYPEAFPGRVKLMEEDAAKGKSMGSGELAGGKGKFALYSATPTAKNQNIWFKSVFKSSKHLIRCEGAWFTDKPTPEIGDACKTLVPQ